MSEISKIITSRADAEERLRERLDSLGMSSNAIAIDIGGSMSDHTIRGFRKREKVPSDDTLLRIERWLDERKGA